MPKAMFGITDRNFSLCFPRCEDCPSVLFLDARWQEDRDCGRAEKSGFCTGFEEYYVTSINPFLQRIYLI